MAFFPAVLFSCRFTMPPAAKRQKTAAVVERPGTRSRGRPSASEGVPPPDDEVAFSLSDADVSRVALEVARVLGQQQPKAPIDTSMPNMDQATLQGDDRELIDSRDPAQDLATALTTALAAQSQGETPSTTIAMPSLSSPLGVDVSDKLRQKIWRGEYVNLYELLMPLENQPYTIQVIPGTSEFSSAINVAPNSKAREIRSLTQWTDAFLIFMAIYSQKFTNSTPDLCKYMSLIRGMEAKYGGDGWRLYDKRHRTLKPKLDLSWDSVFWPEYLEYTTKPRNASANTQNRPFPATTSRGGGGKDNIPRGYCFQYARVGKCSRGAGCIHKHTCHKCSGKHPASVCRSGGSSSTSAKPSSNSHTAK